MNADLTVALIVLNVIVLAALLAPHVRRKVHGTKVVEVPSCVEEPIPLWPSDVILVRCDRFTTADTISRIHQAFDAAFPGYKIMVIDDTIKVSIMRGWISQVELVKRRIMQNGVMH